MKTWAKYPSCEAYKGLLDTYSVKSVTSNTVNNWKQVFMYNPHVYFSIWHKWNTRTKRSEHYRTFFVIWQYKNEILVLSLFLAKNDRGVFGVRVALTSADKVIPLAFTGSCAKYVATFCCYIIRLSSVPVTVARQQCIIYPVELVICLSVKSYPYTISCYFLLISEEIRDELILRGWCDFSEVST